MDYSNLNNKKSNKKLTKKSNKKVGESKATFTALIDYAKVYHPAIVVIENVLTAPWPKMVKAWEAAEYIAHFIKVDTKQYYLPQTRNRGYLVGFHKGKVEAAGLDAETLCAEWIQRMVDFQRPASSSVLEFLLQDDDPRLQQARRDLEGSKTLRSVVDWSRCKVRHSEYREAEKLGEQRPMTHWKSGGTCKMVDFGWGKWIKNQVERIWDVLDMNQLRNVDKGLDPLHVAYV